jgi:16S rRNA (cytidine1402-2'-O)-methyltransferase
MIEPDEALQEAAGTLYVVSTPIGNLGDITFRAVDVLRSVALILCEDTRHSRRLLDRYEIATPVASARLSGGSDLALISDAGTPLLSDPGARLVKAAADAGIRVSPIPGASALLAALVASAMSSDIFTYVGFLPRKGRERAERLQMLSALRHTSVLYEAPGRVSETLAALVESGGGDREVVVARELTKQFEELRRGTVRELQEYYRESPPRGEVAIVLQGCVPAEIDEEALRAQARTLREGGATTREIARSLVESHGAARNLAYRLAQDA